VARAFPLLGSKAGKKKKNEISPKAYPEEMEVIRATSYANTSSAVLLARDFLDPDWFFDFPFASHVKVQRLINDQLPKLEYLKQSISERKYRKSWVQTSSCWDVHVPQEEEADPRDELCYLFAS
jgi:hypothetical protein